MPIRKYSPTATALQDRAIYTRDPKAVLHKYPDRPDLAAMIIYEGVPPKQIPVDDIMACLRHPDNDDNVDKVYRNRIKGRLTAIRAVCVLCNGGQPHRVRTCATVSCPLWPFRMGNNPFRNRS